MKTRAQQCNRLATSVALALAIGRAVQLRAERAGNGTGRVYTITATAKDLAGNTATANATGKVTHDRRRAAQP